MVFLCKYLSFDSKHLKKNMKTNLSPFDKVGGGKEEGCLNYFMHSPIFFLHAPQLHQSPLSESDRYPSIFPINLSPQDPLADFTQEFHRSGSEDV